MVRIPIQRFSAVLIAALAFNSIALTTASAQPQQESPREAYSKKFVIDFDFAGGSLREYVDALRKKADVINVLMDAKAERFPIPEVSFRSVDVTSALHLMHRREAILEGVRTGLHVDMIEPPNPMSQPVYSITAHALDSKHKTTRTSAVLSVKDILAADYTADDMLTAVETAVDLIAASSEPAEIRFHEQTGLLIARGTGEQMAAVHEVIDQLREGIERAHSVQRAHDRNMQQRSEINELRGVIEQHEAERRELMQQLTEARTRAELMQQQYEQTQARVHDYERRVAELRQELTEVRNAYSELERRLQRPNPDGNH